MAGIDFFGKKRKAIWKSFAEEVNGEFVEGNFWRRYRIEIPHDLWTLYIDTYTVSNGKSSTTYTRVYAPYRSAQSFQFNIFQRNVFTDIGKVFGMEDIEVGYPEFDKKFIIKGNDPRYLRQFFEPDPIRGILMLQPSMRFMTRDRIDDRLPRKRYPDRVQDLCYRTVGIIKDPEWLHDICTLVSSSLDQLVEMGCALPQTPEKPPYHHPRG